MMIRNTPKVYDALLSYHTQVRDFYKQLPETSKEIKNITWECNTLVKKSYRLNASNMHYILSHAGFDVEDHEMHTILFQGDEALSTEYDLCCKTEWTDDNSNYQVKGVVYMCIPSHVTKSGKVAYLHVLHKPEFDDLAGVLSKLRRFHF